MLLIPVYFLLGPSCRAWGPQAGYRGASLLNPKSIGLKYVFIVFGVGVNLTKSLFFAYLVLKKQS